MRPSWVTRSGLFPVTERLLCLHASFSCSFFIRERSGTGTARDAITGHSTNTLLCWILGRMDGRGRSTRRTRTGLLHQIMNYDQEKCDVNLSYVDYICLFMLVPSPMQLETTTSFTQQLQYNDFPFGFPYLFECIKATGRALSLSSVRQMPRAS